MASSGNGLAEAKDADGLHERPCFRWTIPGDRVRRTPRGVCIGSPQFQLSGLPDNLQLRFWPKGHGRAAPGSCSVFLWSASAVHLQADVYVNDRNLVMDRRGPAEIKANRDRGWFDFGRQVDDETTIAVVLLSHGQHATPNWPIPSHLRLDSLLGAGSYGSVREAWDTKEQRKVAVKEVLEVFRDLTDAKRILREIAIMSQLQHPNVVRIFDVIEPPPMCGLGVRFAHLYICMELCDTDLRKVCQSPRGVSLPEVKRLAYTLCLGLSYLHALAVYHRDLKPANCLANRDCTVKICDFNLARAVAEEDRAAGDGGPPPPVELSRHLTHLVCTRWYRSPEVVLSMGYTRAMDIWGAGCILAELLGALNTSGRAPNSRPLFRGTHSWPLSGDREQGDQLEQIFDVLGTPFEDPGFAELPPQSQSQLRRYAARPGRGLRAAVPAEAPEEALDLVSGMLRFFPRARLAAGEALGHRFLRRARGAGDEAAGAPGPPLDLGFEDARVGTTREIREEMRRAVDRLRPAPRPPSAGDGEATCICCRGRGEVAPIGVCPLCNGAGILI